MKITTTYPTPLLQDFRTFMDSLMKEETVLSPKNQYMSKERLWELNQLVSFKIDDATPKQDQASYPLLHMFNHLALAGKLAVLIPGKGGRFLLKVSERYEEYLNLTMAEQYFYLLETLWIDGDWEALQKATYGRVPNERVISSIWQELAKSEVGKTLDVKNSTSFWPKRLWDWGYFLWYFTYFGFWQFTLVAIQEAYTFDDDHLYCFFMDNKKWSNDRYESPFVEEGPYADEVTIGELGLNPGKIFLYLFDYGDEWEFKVEVEEINSDRPLPLIPQIVGKRGEAPEQYRY